MSGINLSKIMPYEHLKKVTVDWSYPRLLDKLWYDEQLEGFGLYYISRKFGSKETLLYIGKTCNKFYIRLLAHDYNWLSDYRGKKYIRLGTITYPTNKTDDDLCQLIQDIENALIYEMRWSLIKNTKGMNGYTPKNLYIVTNTGYRGELSPTISMRSHEGSD